MGAVKHFQANLDGVVGDIDAADEADDLASLFGLGLGGLHLLVESGQLLEELVTAAAGLELLGNEALDREGGRGLDGQTGETGKNGQLASDIETVEVVSRVGLRVAKRLCLVDLLRPLAALARGGREGVEEERHGTAKDTFNLGNLVARVDEVLEGGNDGEASTDRRLVVDLGAGRGRGDEDVLPQLVGAGEGLLVGGDDAHATAQSLRVAVGDILGAGVVNQDRLGGRVGQVLDDLGQRGRGLGRGGERIEGGLEADFGVVVVEEGLTAGRNVAERQLGRGSSGSESLELAEEALSNAAGACNWIQG